MGVPRADNSVKFYEICPLAIQNQISKISMHIQFGENPLMFTQVILRKRKTDVRRTDGRTDRHKGVQRETIISRHYCAARYKKGGITMELYEKKIVHCTLRVYTR